MHYFMLHLLRKTFYIFFLFNWTTYVVLDLKHAVIKYIRLFEIICGNKVAPVIKWDSICINVGKIKLITLFNTYI